MGKALAALAIFIVCGPRSRQGVSAITCRTSWLKELDDEPPIAVATAFYLPSGELSQCRPRIVIYLSNTVDCQAAALLAAKGAALSHFYGETAIEVVAFPIEYVATCVSVPLLVSRLNDSIEAVED